MELVHLGLRLRILPNIRVTLFLFCARATISALEPLRAYSSGAISTFNSSTTKQRTTINQPTFIQFNSIHSFCCASVQFFDISLLID